jgi:hypothetical protein
MIKNVLIGDSHTRFGIESFSLKNKANYTINLEGYKRVNKFDNISYIERNAIFTYSKDDVFYTTISFGGCSTGYLDHESYDKYYNKIDYENSNIILWFGYCDCCWSMDISNLEERVQNYVKIAKNKIKTKNLYFMTPPAPAINTNLYNYEEAFKKYQEFVKELKKIKTINIIDLQDIIQGFIEIESPDMNHWPDGQYLLLHEYLSNFKGFKNE